MALAYFAGRLITGTASDRTGGTWTNLAAGWRFFETDTSQMYYWNGSAWVNAVKTPFVFTGARSMTTFTTLYGTWFASSVGEWASAETNRMPFNFTFDAKLMTVSVGTNTLNGNAVISFRDDGNDVTGASITVASTDTGILKTTGALSATIAAGSLCNWKIDSTAASSGSCLFKLMLEGYIYTA